MCGLHTCRECTNQVSRYFKVETLSSVKLAAVLISFGGVILVSLSDSNATSGLVAEDIVARPLLGDSMALISAIFYALYVILLKVKIKSEERIDMQLFFGFVGFFNIVALWPIALILNWTSVEALEWPSSGKVVVALVVNVSSHCSQCLQTTNETRCSLHGHPIIFM